MGSFECCCTWWGCTSGLRPASCSTRLDQVCCSRGRRGLGLEAVVGALSEGLQEGGWGGPPTPAWDQVALRWL